MFCDQLNALIHGPRDLINLSLAAYCTVSWPALPLLWGLWIKERRHHARLEKKLEQERSYTQRVKEDFQRVHEAGLDGVAYVGLDHRFKFLNIPFSEIAGWPLHSLLGKTFDEITHAEDLPFDLENLQRLLDKEIDRYTMPKRYFAQDGTERPVELTVTLHRNESGEPLHFIARIRALPGGWHYD